jgi:hypothetical protein
MLARAIHDDRVRDMERILRDRRLLQAPDETESAAVPRTTPARPVQVSESVARGGSACEPA